MPPSAELPQITTGIGGTKFVLAGFPVILYVGDTRGASADLRARGRVVRGVRGHVDVENRGDQSLAVELQEDFAAVAVLREQFGLANIRIVDFVLMGVVLEDGFGLRERRAAEKRDAEPVVDESTGERYFVVVESVKLLEVKLSVAKLHVDGIAARLGVAIEIEKVSSLEIGVHASLGEIAIVVEGGESFGFGFVSAGNGGHKAKRGCKERRKCGARDGRQHERSVLGRSIAGFASLPAQAGANPKPWFSGLDEEGDCKVRVKRRAAFRFGTQ